MEKLLFLPKHRNNKAQLLSEMTIFFFYLVLERFCIDSISLAVPLKWSRK